MRDDEDVRERDEDVQDGTGGTAVRREGVAVVARLLTGAAAVPVVVTAEASRRVMTGGLDRVFTATYSDYPGPSADLRQRFDWLIDNVPVGATLLTSAVGLLVVAALHLSGRDPGRRLRLAAAAVAGAVALGGGAFLAGVVLDVLDDPATRSGATSFVGEYPAFVRFGPQSAEVLLTVVLAVCTAVALLRPPRPAAAAAAPVDTLGPQPSTGPEPALQVTAPPEPAPRAEGGLPRPPAEELVHYRRPG